MVDQPQDAGPQRRPDGTMLPGHTANRKGRPPGSRNMLTLFNDKRDEKISLKVDGRATRMTRLEAWVTNLWNKAIACDPKASAMVLAIMRVSGQLERRRAICRSLAATMPRCSPRWSTDSRAKGPTMIDQQRAFRAAIRLDLATFIHRTFREVAPSSNVSMSWYMQAIAWHLRLCAERKIKRLVINIPPRYGKSTSASVAFVAWLLGLNPAERIVCVSYSAELAGRFARDTRTVMQSRWYREAFPGTRLGSRTANHDFHTTRKGYRFTTSVDGTLTGVGGMFFLIDDPNPASDERSAVAREAVNDWYRGTLRSRMDDPRTGVIVVIQQRIHSDDLSGYLLENVGEGWVHLNLPAIATCDEQIAIGPGRWHQRRVGDVLDPERENRAELDLRLRSMTSQTFSAQYLQNPVPDDGEIVKWSWFKRYQREPNWEDGDRYVQSWDTASKVGELNDFSVCTTWLIKGRDYYLLDVWRGRANFPDLKRQVYAQAARWGIDALLIEDKGSGTQLIAQLVEENDAALPRPLARLPKEDKATRMAAQTDRIEQGHVHIPVEASWLATFRSEMLQFPKSKHDDQVDSLSQFLQWATERPDVGSFFHAQFRSSKLSVRRGR